MNFSRLSNSVADVQHTTLGRSLFGKNVWPIALRGVGITAALVTNLLVARRLTLDQIAFYYLYATLAYFGNAGLYVGLNVVLQRHCASLASLRAIHKRFFIKFVSASLVAGSFGVVLFSGGYLIARGGDSNPWHTAMWCAILSGATYLSSIGRDLLALSRRLTLAATFGLVEQLLRLSFVTLAVSYLHTGALDVTAAGATASAVAGLCAIALIVVTSSALPEGVTPTLRLSEIVRTVTPVGLSGLMNWVQLQSYRPILLFFGTRPEIVGITALLTNLGTMGANPVLAVTGQTYVPRLYAGDKSAFRDCMIVMGRIALILACASIPAAFCFLLLSGRKDQLIYLLVVPLGVLVETANNVVGVLIHRQNAGGKSMWMFAVSGGMGVLVAAAAWIIPVSQASLPYLVGLGLVASQAAVVGTFWMINFWNRSRDA